MKSIKLIKAMGNISDELIAEAADPIKISESSDDSFQEPISVSVPKTKIRFAAFIPFAAVLAITFAVVITAQTVIFHNSAFDLNRLLDSHGTIAGVSIQSDNFVNIDTERAEEFVAEAEKSVAEWFSKTEHKISDKYPSLSEQSAKSSCSLFFYYTDGEHVAVTLFDEMYYIGTDEESYACDGANEDYEQLLEFLDNYIKILKSDLKVTAELDGYKAEQRVEYMMFYLDVTFPDGETASISTALSYYGDFDDQIQILPFPETEILKLTNGDKTEYVVMQKVGYDGDNKRVMFIGCDPKNHILIKYKNDNVYNPLTVSDGFMQEKEGCFFYDIPLEQKTYIDIEKHSYDTTEYFSWERECPEIVFSDLFDIDMHFSFKRLELDPDARLDGVIEGDLLYYYKREVTAVNSVKYTLGMIIEENMRTGEKRTVVEGSSDGAQYYDPICIHNGCLYFYALGDTYYSSIQKVDLMDNSVELLYTSSEDNESFGGHVAAENGIYFYDSGVFSKKVYFLDFSDNSVRVELDAADSVYRYKNGIVYTYGDDVFYRGSDDLYCVETLENGDKKLFEFDNPREYFYEYIFCNGEYLAVSKPYDTYSAWWREGGTAIMLYDDKEGLKPLGKIDGICLLGGMATEVCGGGEILQMNGILFDVKDDLFLRVPYSYEPPGLDYETEYNYSDGSIYYMTYNYGLTDIEGILCRENAEFYRLTLE